MQIDRQRQLQAAEGLARIYRDLAAQLTDFAAVLDRSGVASYPVIGQDRFIGAMRAGMVLQILQNDAR